MSRVTDVPELQMLWEAADPRRALGGRFGFADGQAAARWVASVLEGAYGITMTTCERVVMSDRNALAWTATDRGPLIVKWCVAAERFDRLADVADLTAWLAGRGAPVSEPLRALDGRHQVGTDGASVGVQRVVDGDLLYCADDALVHAAGEALAALHLDLADCPLAPTPAATAPAATSRALLAGRLEGLPAHLPRAAVEALRAQLGQAPEVALPVQVVHGDYRSANILCRGGRVVAVLDFEEARVDHAVAELARAAVLLGTRFRDWRPVTPHTRTVLREGYESVRAPDRRRGGVVGPLRALALAALRSGG